MSRARIIGADFSRYQGLIPVQACADAGIEFGWFKGGHGTSPDPMFARNWSASRGRFARGRGAYIWLTTNDPILQAESIVARLETTGDTGELFTAVDNEQVSALRDEALVLHVLKALRRIRELGGNAAHYSGKWYLDERIGPHVSTELLDELASYPYWHAEYPRTEVADRRACGLGPPLLSSPHLPALYLARGTAQAVWQWDGDGGCVLPNGVDADFNEANEAGMRLVTRELQRDTWPTPAPDDTSITVPDAPSPIRRASSQRLPAVRMPIIEGGATIDADDGRAATPLRASEPEDTT